MFYIIKSWGMACTGVPGFMIPIQKYRVSLHSLHMHSARVAPVGVAYRCGSATGGFALLPLHLLPLVAPSPR